MSSEDRAQETGNATWVLSAFTMNVVSHLSAGLWAHPDDQGANYTDLSYWTTLAKTLDQGGFDAMFIADVLGLLDVWQGRPDAALRAGLQSPVNDPVVAVSAMAAVTEHLGFGVTMSTTYMQPYQLARTFSTLDHYTNGRIAWNVVTSVLDSAARNLGLERQLGHDERYELAQEFIEVTYKLWEGSWEDDAVVCDRSRRLYADPAKVHPIGHKGKYFSVPGAHLSEPSPQRTPVIFQAGASPRGREFAARNAELVLLGGTSAVANRAAVADTRARAKQLGRDLSTIKFLTIINVVTGPDDSAAHSKYEEYLRYVDKEAALALFSAGSGVDWSSYDLDRPLRYIETDANRSVFASLVGDGAGRDWTLRQLAQASGVGHLYPTVVGGPGTVADELERLASEHQVDGFNLASIVSPGSYVDFVEHVVPELRRRGRMAAAPSKGSLRERLFGPGRTRLDPTHPGAKHRVADRPGENAV